MSQWQRNETEVLVELYENYPILYAAKSADNYNRNLKRNALEELTKQLNIRLKKNFNVEEVKSKITNLRSQFIEITGKVQASKTSGAGTDDVYKPIWFLYNRLHFIMPHIVHRKGKSNKMPSSSYQIEFESQDVDSTLTESQSQIESDEIGEEVTDPILILPEPGNGTDFFVESRSTTQSPESLHRREVITPSTSTETPNGPRRSTKRQKNNPADNFFEKAMDAMQQLTAAPISTPAKIISNDDEDELYHFFNYMRAETKKLNSEAQQYVKQACFNSVLEAKTRFH